MERTTAGRPAVDVFASLGKRDGTGRKLLKEIEYQRAGTRDWADLESSDRFGGMADSEADGQTSKVHDSSGCKKIFSFS